MGIISQSLCALQAAYIHVRRACYTPYNNAYNFVPRLLVATITIVSLMICTTYMCMAKHWQAKCNGMQFYMLVGEKTMK